MDIGKMMKQAQQMQADMAAAQAKLASEEVEASVGGGKVVVRATCNGDLEDLVLAGVQQALKQGRQKSEAELGKVTSELGGLGIPGLG